jgi:hypothetical protein
MVDNPQQAVRHPPTNARFRPRRAANRRNCASR